MALRHTFLIFMLSTATNYRLTKKWLDERNSAMSTGKVTGEYTREQLGLTEADLIIYMNETYDMWTTPTDPLGTKKKFDLRNAVL